MEKYLFVMLLVAFSPWATAHCGSCGVGGDSQEESHSKGECTGGAASCADGQKKSTAEAPARPEETSARPTQNTATPSKK